MKKFAFIIAAMLAALLLGGCAGGNGSGSARPSEDGAGIVDEEREIDMIKITCGARVLEIELADTLSARALADKLTEGDLTVSMRGYGGFEMVGALGFSLESRDERMTTEVGDVVLYSGNQIVIFYDSNSWEYTRIGHIAGANRDMLEEFFATTGQTEVTFSASDGGN